MSQKEEDELNENELDSLLADLESRAGGGQSTSASSSEDDDEDLEAFLNRLESEESSSSPPAKVATKERDDLDAQFAELDNLAPDDLPAKIDKKGKKDKKKSKKEKSKKDKKSSTAVAKADGEATGDETPSRGARIAKIGLKWAAFALPVVVLTWVLGAFLANWISAGWLIAIVAMTFALGVPALAKHFAKRGKFSWWAAGLGVALTVALTAPMPQTAGETMTRYGHWPASAVADVAGWEVDNALVQINSSVAGLVGGLLYSGAELAPNQLGTEHPLEPTDAPEASAPDTPDAPATEPTEP